MAGGHDAAHGPENKGVALIIAILALFLALAEVGAKSAQAEALNATIEAAIITGLAMLVWLAGAPGAVGFGLMMLGFFAPGLIHF